jgi:predicted aspartyl protease
MNNIKFREFGRVYLIIDIKPIDGITLYPFEFKVDTGADTTTISKSALARIGYDMDWIEKNAVIYKDEDKPTTASGDKINAGYIQLPLIHILGYEGKYWPFQVIMDKDKDFRNLLGRDLLTGFNYWFSNDDDVFTIDRAKTFKPRYTFLPNQEINEMALVK